MSLFVLTRVNFVTTATNATGFKGDVESNFFGGG